MVVKHMSKLPVLYTVWKHIKVREPN